MRNEKEIIEEVKKYVEEKLSGEGTGHDWWHALRVCEMSKKIAKKEGGDLFVIQLAALLHDIADWKFSKGNVNIGVEEAKKLLKELSVDQSVIDNVCHIIKHISFKGAGSKNEIKTKEGKIVQDADRIDVIGAIGIARVFAYGGFVRREIFNPKIKPKFHKTFQEYKKNKSSSINHFYEKVLLLEHKMNTKTGKNIAGSRHKFTQNYLKQFFSEWSGKV